MEAVSPTILDNNPRYSDFFWIVRPFRLSNPFKNFCGMTLGTRASISIQICSMIIYDYFPKKIW